MKYLEFNETFFGTLNAEARGGSVNGDDFDSIGP